MQGFTDSPKRRFRWTPVFVSSGRLAEWLRDQLGPGQVDIILQPSELCD